MKRARRKEKGRRDGIVLLDVWRVRGRQVGKRWLARAWDARKRAYRSKSYEDGQEEAALQWAKDEQAKFTIKLSSSGKLELSSLITSYAEDLDRRKRTEKHVAEVKRVLGEASAAGVGDLKSDGIRDDVRRWLAKGKDLSVRSRNKRLVILNGAIQHALGEGLLLTNPIDGVRGETEAAAGKLREVFSPVELAEMVSDKHRDQTYWPEVCALVYLGLRIGEAVAIRWGWFDWAGRVVRIRQEDDFSPKRHQERAVPLMTEAVDLFKPMGQLAGRLSRRDSRVIPKASEAFGAYLKAIGLEAKGRGAHCVRHSWVSLRLALGRTSLVVQHEAGHRSITTTAKYAHAIPAGWIDGWPKDGSGEFWLRRKIPSPVAPVKEETNT